MLEYKPEKTLGAKLDPHGKLTARIEPNAELKFVGRFVRSPLLGDPARQFLSLQSRS
jgi:hypothetical protein